MVGTSTKTKTNTYTSARIFVIEDQFEILMRYGGFAESRRRAIKEEIEKENVQELGLVVEKNGYRIAEVSLEVNWALHKQLVKLEGEAFDQEKAGWENGECPEVSVYAARIAHAAKDVSGNLRSWIRFSDSVRSKPEQHKELCEKLGFAYGCAPPPFMSEGGSIKTKEIRCFDLPELTIRGREIPGSA